ncbi:hypothetical protein LCGC14_1121340 [marine sediment metagenome]|uniref:Uncharacterized protein n=1 Tax=marine sediment metagenome TaxID=412755 RepID=A0A0F9Q9K9_9ZZZZ
MEFEVQGDQGLFVPKGNRVNGTMLVQQGGSLFEAAVARGNVFSVVSQTTVTTQAGLSATTPGLTIANLNGSGKEVILWYAAWATLVSASAAFQAWLAYGAVHATAVVATTPSTTVINSKTGAPGEPGGVRVLDVATLPAAPVAVALLGGASSAAITVGLQNAEGGRWFHGDRKLQSGSNFSIQTSTAGTIFTEFVFEVVDKV